ncbi:MAG: type II secretion system F family protein [DPANN group archaeon]|nr:type II secretion system F family protein [DPANN group archaeon]
MSDDDIVDKGSMESESYSEQNTPSTHSTSQKRKRSNSNIKGYQDVQKDYVKAIYHKYPAKYRALLEKEAIYAGIKHPIDHQAVIISRFFMFLFLALLVVANLFLLMPTYLFLTISLFFIVVSFFVPYIIYTVMADNRTKDVEKILSDVLILASSNIKSGYTIDKALIFSARKEFGALSVEIKKTAFMIYSGIKPEKAFKKLTDNIYSEHLERVINLLVEGMKNGGQIATLLEESANDIENAKVLKKEINSSIQMYLIFIIIAGVIASPIMFAISSYLISSTIDMWGGMGDFGSKNMGSSLMSISPSAPSVDPAFFDGFAITAIFITNFFAGLVISLIKNGNIKGGINYSPIFVVVSIVIFFIAKHILFVLMGGL